MTQRRLPLAGVVTVPSTKPLGGRSPYRRGARYERELRASFTKDGLLCVRSAGSEGPFDLLVALPHGGRAVQAKSATAPPPAWLIARWLRAMPTPPPGWTAELWLHVAGRGWRQYPAKEEQSA